MYRNGRGVQQNYAEAVDWYRKAAMRRQPRQTTLGLMYYDGQGVTQDYVESVAGIAKLPTWKTLMLRPFWVLPMRKAKA